MVAEKDRKRQADLEKAGFTEIRFTDKEVLNSISSVHAQIEGLVIKIMTEKEINPKVRKRKI
jgi:very-short-patch-repair endonuclease